MRGDDRCRLDRPRPRRRISPTSAPHAWGRPPTAPRALSQAADQPHVRGDDYWDHDVISKLPDGSALRAWGRRRRAISSRPSTTDQPHVRGDYRGASAEPTATLRISPTCVETTATPDAELAARAGSAPRAWGRLPTTCRRTRPRSDQPHVRGDDVHRAARRGSGERISPTCVGTTREVPADMARLRWISPTCVGTTDD